MDKQQFDQLVKGVKEMKRHIAGKTVRGAVSVELPVPDVRVLAGLHVHDIGYTRARHHQDLCCTLETGKPLA